MSFFPSPNFLYELQYKHLAMKFEDSESRGQILISRHSTPTFPQKRFPAAVDALCFHPCRPRRFKPTAHTSLAMPPCHLSAAPWPFGLHWHPFRNLWVPKAQLLLKYREWKNLGGWEMRSNTETVSSKKKRYSKDIPLLVSDLSHPYNRSSLRR